MSDRTHLRTRLGKRFSEGSRRLWLLLEERGWSQGDLATDVSAARTAQTAPQPPPTESRKKKKRNTGVVIRWLYGDRTPDRDFSLLLQGRYGIDAGLWSKRPEEPFTPPGAREAA
jgi:hypothetical protein